MSLLHHKDDEVNSCLRSEDYFGEPIKAISTPIADVSGVLLNERCAYIFCAIVTAQYLFASILH